MKGKIYNYGNNISIHTYAFIPLIPYPSDIQSSSWQNIFDCSYIYAAEYEHIIWCKNFMKLNADLQSKSQRKFVSP